MGGVASHVPDNDSAMWCAFRAPDAKEFLENLVCIKGKHVTARLPILDVGHVELRPLVLFNSQNRKSWTTSSPKSQRRLPSSTLETKRFVGDKSVPPNHKLTVSSFCRSGVNSTNPSMENNRGTSQSFETSGMGQHNGIFLMSSSQ